MKIFHKLALAVTLATSVSGLALVSPAIAKKKDEAKAGLKLSPDVIKSAQIAQPAIAAKDFATAEPAVVAIEAAAALPAGTPDDKYVAAALRYDLESQKLFAAQTANPNTPVNETVLAGPLDALIASPSTPPADLARYNYRRGSLAFNGKQYPQALTYYNRAKQLGYTDPNFGLQIVKAKMESGDVAGASADLDAQITAMTAAGQKAPEDYYRYAIAKSNARKLKPETMTWLAKYAAAYPTAKNWRDIAVTYGLQQNPVATLDNVQKIDLFRLMRATKSLADQYDYMEYAQKVSDRGLPAESQAVLNEGLASGKIPATNKVAKEMLADAAAKIRSDTPLATIEKRATTAADGKLAASTADAYLGENNYAKSAELYQLALQKGGVDADDVNTHLGIALANSGDKAGATAAFAAVKGAPRSEIAGLWSTWVNQTAA